MQGTNERLYQAVFDNDVDTVREILEGRGRYDINYVSPGGDGTPLLTEACNQQHFRIARLLVKHGADVNLGNDGSVDDKFKVKTPLNMTITATITLARLGIPDAQDERNALEGFLEELLRRGANPNYNPESGTSSLGQLFFYCSEDTQETNLAVFRILTRATSRRSVEDLKTQGYSTRHVDLYLQKFDELDALLDPVAVAHEADPVEEAVLDSPVAAAVVSAGSEDGTTHTQSTKKARTGAATAVVTDEDQAKERDTDAARGYSSPS